MYSNYSPVFVLSTGRIGTAFLTALFGKSNNIKSCHEMVPRMELFCNDIYYNNSELEKLSMVFNAIRYDLILNAYIRNKIYFESNHALTFFAYAIQNCFKNARFIHIIRHPESFIRSAIVKKWYKKNGIWDLGRLKIRDKSVWDSMDQIEKLSWLWNATNQFIEDFKENNPGSNNIFTVKFEELFSDAGKMASMVRFAGARRNDENFIRKFMGIKIHGSSANNDSNKKSGKLQYFKHGDRAKIEKYTSELVRKYYP
jgi:hypothetical protein